MLIGETPTEPRVKLEKSSAGSPLLPSCPVVSHERRAVGPGHAHVHSRLDDVAEADLLLQVDEVQVDGLHRRLGELPGLGAVRRTFRVVVELRRCGLAVTGGERPYRGRRLHLDRVAEGQALLERRDQGEDLGRRAGLHSVLVAAILIVDRVVDVVLAGAAAVLPVHGDGLDVAGAGLDQHLGVGVVARVRRSSCTAAPRSRRRRRRRAGLSGSASCRSRARPGR